ncbi:MAG: BON domain-containing protein [Nitrospirae bacterium]|nr:BON domain-containing protein [Nitrospirota bacterium]
MRDPMRLSALLVCLAMLLALSGCASTRTMESAGEYVDDSVITTKVKAALVGDPVTKARQISVETFKGVVQLSGFVNTYKEKDRAGQLAYEVSGVRGVRNTIQVK